MWRFDAVTREISVYCFLHLFTTENWWWRKKKSLFFSHLFWSNSARHIICCLFWSVREFDVPNVRFTHFLDLDLIKELLRFCLVLLLVKSIWWVQWFSVRFFHSNRWAHSLPLSISQSSYNLFFRCRTNFRFLQL